MNATEIPSALSARAEDVCRHYLPRGTQAGQILDSIGDTSGAKGRSPFVRLAASRHTRVNGPTPRPTSMAICSTSSVCAPAEHLYAAPWRRPSRSSRCRRPPPPMAAITPAATSVKKRHAASLPAYRWHPCGSPSARPRHRPLPLGPDRPISSIATTMASTASRRWLHAVTGRRRRRAGTALPGSTPSDAGKAVPRAKRLGGSIGRAVRRRVRLQRDPCRGKGIETVPSAGTAVPRILAATAPQSRHLPKISPSWSSLAIKDMEGTSTPRTVFSTVARNAAFPQS